MMNSFMNSFLTIVLENVKSIVIIIFYFLRNEVMLYLCCRVRILNNFGDMMSFFNYKLNKFVVF